MCGVVYVWWRGRLHVLSFASRSLLFFVLSFPLLLLFVTLAYLEVCCAVLCSGFLVKTTLSLSRFPFLCFSPPPPHPHAPLSSRRRPCTRFVRQQKG